jgi:uncharacterized protein (DUF885 family)
MSSKSNKPLRKILAVVLALSLFMTACFSSSCLLIPPLLKAADNITNSSVTNTSGTESTSSQQEATAGQDDSAQLKSIDFDMFSDNVTSDTLSLYFAVKDPAALNLPVPAVGFGDVSKEKADASCSKDKEYLEQLNKINYDNLSDQEKITYDVIQYDLNEALDYQKYYYYSSAFNSITGLQTELPLVLSEYTFTDKADIDQYLLLLSDLDRYYTDMMTFETKRADLGLGATDTNIQKIIDSCNSFLKDTDNHFLISSFSERLDKVSGLTDAEKADYISKNKAVLKEHVFPAYQILIDGFESLKGKGVNNKGLCSLPDGKAYYELLLKSQTSSDASVETVTKQIEQAVSDEIDIIQASPTDSTFQKDYSNYNFSKGTVQENLDYCSNAIKNDFPTIMDHNVTLKEVPAALEDFFSPAAYLSCTIDDPKDNLILTNTSALTGYKDLLETIAHEGYPGHMYESIYQAQNLASYYQRTASFIGYSEGWAEYAAGYILQNSDYNQKLVSYVSAENQIFNILLPSRIDIGVNYEGWSQQDVYNYLKSYNLEMNDYADYCYNMAIEIPCYYMPYCVGHLNTSEIIANAENKIGKNVSLQEIHKAYLDIGPAPFQIIEKYMDKYIQTK